MSTSPLIISLHEHENGYGYRPAASLAVRKAWEEMLLNEGLTDAEEPRTTAEGT